MSKYKTSYRSVPDNGAGSLSGGVLKVCFFWEDMVYAEVLLKWVGQHII